MSDHAALRPEDYPSGDPSVVPTSAPTDVTPGTSTYSAAEGSTSPGGVAEGTSAGDTAKDQARSVAGDVKGQTQQVAAHAAQETKAVVDQAKNQFKDLLWQSRSELTQQASGQQHRLAQGLRSFGQELDEMTSGSQRQGLAGEAASQLSGRVAQAAEFLENRDFGGVLDELTSFARRRPGAFLLGAALVGVVAGRVTRGLTADSDDAGVSATGSGGRVQRMPYESVTTELGTPAPAPYAATEPYATTAGGTAYQTGAAEPVTGDYAFPDEVADPPGSDAYPPADQSGRPGL